MSKKLVKREITDAVDILLDGVGSSLKASSLDTPREPMFQSPFFDNVIGK